MNNRSNFLVFALVPGLALPAIAADTPQPVRMGCGLMTFDTVPGWGLGPDGKSVIGPCHGSVVVDKEGNIYTSAHAGVFVFTPEGKALRSFVGDKYSDIHDVKIRDEDGVEFLYGARNANAEGIKFDSKTGEIVAEAPVPRGVGAEAGRSSTPRRSPSRPTAPSSWRTATRSDHVFKFDKAGKYLIALRDQGERAQGVQHGPRHDARHPIRAPPDC